MAPHSSTLAWKIPWRRSLVGCSPWGLEESDTTERLHFHVSLSSIGGGNGNPLQNSCLENPRDGGAWWAAVYGVAQSRTRLKRLSSSSIACGILVPQHWTHVCLNHWTTSKVPSEHLFICLLPICIFSLEKMSVQVFYPFLRIICLLFWLSNCLYILDFGHIICKYFLPFSKLSSFCHWFPLLCKSF